MTKPVILLAFANYEQDAELHLRGLVRENKEINNALQKAQREGICEVITLPDATLDEIMQVFATKQVAIFHYAGHANDYELMIEQSQSADAQAFSQFLGQQDALQLVFLNACSTKGHVDSLIKNGVKVVIATSAFVQDRVATEFAKDFYGYLGLGKSIFFAFNQFEAKNKINKVNPEDLYIPKAHRALIWGVRKEEPINTSVFPWFYTTTDDFHLKWNLADASRNPLFGLPPLAFTPADYPPDPFRYLQSYDRQHAAIFFGRAYQIRELYDKVIDPLCPPVMLVYGQSGVGKTSLAHAGLLPYLEITNIPITATRHPEKGLLQTLREALEITDTQTNIKQKWQQLEQERGRKPLIVIIDNVEGALLQPLNTPNNPNEKPANELQAFINELAAIFNDTANKPLGKIILLYRKEYHSEIDMRIKQATIPRTRSFIEPLTKEGIIDVFKGLTENRQAKLAYNLSVETGLPDIIAADLLRDRESAIAPVLQILLAKMWDEVKNLPDAHLFTLQLYSNLRDEGLLLNSFIDRSLSLIKQGMEGAVESGFVLELLRSFINNRGSVTKLNFSYLVSKYPYAQQVLKKLTEQLTAQFLLVETPASVGGTEFSLAHDILATTIREMYDQSDLPVQRAMRILRNKETDWKNKQNKANLLTETDVILIDSAIQWLPKPDKTTQELLERSRKHWNRQQVIRKYRKIIIAAAFMALSLFTIAFIFLWRQAVDKTLLALSYDLSYKSATLLPTQPTKSFRLAEYAHRAHKNNRSFQALWNAYHQSAMYTEFSGHQQALNSARLSPDGNRLITASDDNTAIVWFLQSGDTMAFHCPARVNYATFSPSGAQILLALSNNTAVLYNANRTPIATFAQHQNEVRSAEFSPTQNRIITASWDKTVKIWDTNGSLLLSVNAHDNYVNRAVFSHSGTLFATASADNTAKIWSANGTLLHTLTGHTSAVNQVAFSPNDQYLITTSDDNTARLWTVNNGEPLAVLSGHSGFVEWADFFPDGSAVVTAARDFTLKIWSLDGIETRSINTPGSFTYSVQYVNICAACQPGNTYLLTASEDNTARLWSMQSNMLAPAYADIKQITYAPDGQYLLSTGRSNKATLWNTNGVKIADFSGHNATVLFAAFSPDGKQVITSSADSTAKIWNLDGRERLTLKAHTDVVTAALFTHNPQANLIATCGRDRMVRLWSTNGKLIRTLAAHTQPVETIAFSPDNRYIVSAGRDSTAIIWQVSNGKPLYTLKGHKAAIMKVTYSPDGKYIATASRDKTVLLWTASGILQQRLIGHTEVVNTVAFFPEGNRLVTASADKSAKVWNLKGEELFTLTGHDAPIESVAFSPDKSRLLTASKDGVARVWLINPTAMIANANQRRLAFLSAADMKQYDIETYDQRSGNGLNWLFKERNAARLNAYAQYHELMAKQKKSATHFRQAEAIYNKLFQLTGDSSFIYRKKQVGRE